MAKAATKSATGTETEVTRLLGEAVLKLAGGTGPMKLQAKKGENDGLFPAGTAGAIKEAVRRATADEPALFRSAGKVGKVEVFELTPAGVAGIGAAVAEAARTMPAAEAIRLAERVMEKHPPAVVELEPLIADLSRRQAEEAEREEKARREDAERQQRVREAMKRWEAGVEHRKQARIAELTRELDELGGVIPTGSGPPEVGSVDANSLQDEIARLTGELRSARAAAVAQPGVAPEDSRDFVRNVARRLVAVWAEAVDKGNVSARNALEVALGNVSAIEPIGEEGEEVEYDPQRHESATPIDPGTAVTVERPGWVLAEQAGVMYVIQRARVGG